ncbi:MAG: hypothetical protein AB7L41_06550 [Flavobacteriaceae bacterium]
MRIREAFWRLPHMDEDGRLEALYDRMPAGGHSIKRTTRGRMRALDAELVELIDERFAPGIAIRIHDAGASNAITSAELFAAMKRPRAMLASDLYDHISDVRVGPFHVTFNALGEPMEVALGRWALKSRGSVLKTVAAAPRAWIVAMARARGRPVVRIPLFHPEALALAEREAGFRLAHGDLFDPDPGPFEVVRIVNLLGSRNFPLDMVRRGLRALSRTLVEGGLLVAGRTRDEEDGTPDVTIFARRGDGLVALRELGHGYEHCDEALALDLAQLS